MAARLPKLAILISAYFIAFDATAATLLFHNIVAIFSDPVGRCMPQLTIRSELDLTSHSAPSHRQLVIKQPAFGGVQ